VDEDDINVVKILSYELDIVLERYMTKSEAADGQDPGRAESLAYAIAVIENPDRPDMPAILRTAVQRIKAQMRE
jgi:hypothetical protein